MGLRVVFQCKQTFFPLICFWITPHDAQDLHLVLSSGITLGELRQPYGYWRSSLCHYRQGRHWTRCNYCSTLPWLSFQSHLGPGAQTFISRKQAIEIVWRESLEKKQWVFSLPQSFVGSCQANSLHEVRRFDFGLWVGSQGSLDRAIAMRNNEFWAVWLGCIELTYFQVLSLY